MHLSFYKTKSRFRLACLLAIGSLVLAGCSNDIATSTENEEQETPAVENVAVHAPATPAVAKATLDGSQVLPEVVVYKSPTCGCCSKWVKHLERAGFTVTTKDHENMSPIKQKLGVPGNLASCHTATVGRYVIEGHVPADDVKRLLREQPDIAGLAVPGMPLGSPGMEHPRPQNYNTVTFSKVDRPTLFARHGPDADAYEQQL